MQPDLIITPFGENADPSTIRTIPESKSPSDPKQDASWSTGFPAVTMKPIQSGGIPPEGPDMNGVLNAISGHTVFVGGGGQYKWSDAYVAAKGGYAKGSVIQSDAGDFSYISTVDGNTENFNSSPSSIGVKWILYSDYLLRQDLAAPTGSWLTGTVQLGTGSVARLLKEKVNERVSILDFGAEAGNPSNNVSLALKKALASRTRVQVVIPCGDWYGGPASAADENLVVMMTEGKFVVFEKGARVFFGQSGDTYLPFFAGISSSKWGIINPHFVWNGQIRWSTTGDLQYAIPGRH